MGDDRSAEGALLDTVRIAAGLAAISFEATIRAGTLVAARELLAAQIKVS
jgi:hypothetical protein